MDELAPGHNLQPVSRMLAGALAHLAQHMNTGCPRAAHFAANLLDQVAVDPKVDPHLRRHAYEMVEILERDLVHVFANDAAPKVIPRADLNSSLAGKNRP